VKTYPKAIRSAFLSALLSATATSVLAATTYSGSFLANSQGGSALGIGPTDLVVGENR